MLIFGYGQVSVTCAILESIGGHQRSARYDQGMVKTAFVFLILASQLGEVEAIYRQANSRATYEAIAAAAATLQAARAFIKRSTGPSDLMDRIRTDEGDNPNQDHNESTESARTDFATLPDIFTQEFEDEVDTVVRVIGGNEPCVAFVIGTLRESPNTLLVTEKRARNRSRFHCSVCFWENVLPQERDISKNGVESTPTDPVITPVERQTRAYGDVIPYQYEDSSSKNMISMAEGIHRRGYDPMDALNREYGEDRVINGSKYDPRFAVDTAANLCDGDDAIATLGGVERDSVGYGSSPSTSEDSSAEGKDGVNNGSEYDPRFAELSTRTYPDKAASLCDGDDTIATLGGVERDSVGYGSSPLRSEDSSTEDDDTGLFSERLELSQKHRDTDTCETSDKDKSISMGQHQRGDAKLLEDSDVIQICVKQTTTVYLVGGSHRADGDEGNGRSSLRTITQNSTTARTIMQNITARKAQREKEERERKAREVAQALQFDAQICYDLLQNDDRMEIEMEEERELICHGYQGDLVNELADVHDDDSRDQESALQRNIEEETMQRTKDARRFESSHEDTQTVERGRYSNYARTRYSSRYRDTERS